MVRFLHTADWQMGMKAVHAGPRARALRDIRFHSANNVVKLAHDLAVDFVLIAGDTFEHPDVDEVTVRRTTEILDRFEPIPVFVLPGNHDPWTTGSIWHRHSWRRVAQHVMLCTQPTPIQINEACIVYPCPLTQKQSASDPTLWVPKRDEGDDRVRIGLAHGGLSILPKAPNFPILPSRAEESGLDYLALGDWHGFFQHGKAVYSGTMEATSFDESDPGNALLVEISAAGAVATIEKRRVGELRWTVIQLAVRDDSDVELFERQLKELGDVESVVIKVIINPASLISETAASQLATIRAELLDTAFFVDWVDEPQITADVSPGLAAYPGVFQSVYHDLAAIADGDIPDGPGRDFASTDTAVIQSAMSLLRRMAHEAEE